LRARFRLRADFIGLLAPQHIYQLVNIIIVVLRHQCRKNRILRLLVDYGIH